MSYLNVRVIIIAAITPVSLSPFQTDCSLTLLITFGLTPLVFKIN